MRDPLWRGIERHGHGYRARVSQGRDMPRLEHYFPAGTDPREMQAWREDVKAGLRINRKQRASMGTFEGDARRYLRAVAAMVSFQDRKHQIEAWIGVFGAQRRSTITSTQIRLARDTWLREPRAKGKPPLTPSTVNKRLRALSNLYAVLDGDAPNPVRSVPEAVEPAPKARSMSYDVIAAILAQLPDEGRGEKGKKRPLFSATKVRIRCLAYSQITLKQLSQLTPADLDLDNARLQLPSRAKGKGAASIWTPLLPDAVSAFRDFAAHGLFGKFSGSSLRKSFKTAARNAGVLRHVRPHDLRHSYGTMAYRATKSLEAVAQLMQHVSPSTTRQYAQEAEADVIATHGATVGRHFGATGSGQDRKQAEIIGQENAEPRRIQRRVRQKRP